MVLDYGCCNLLILGKFFASLLLALNLWHVLLCINESVDITPVTITLREGVAVGNSIAECVPKLILLAILLVFECLDSCSVLASC